MPLLLYTLDHEPDFSMNDSLETLTWLLDKTRSFGVDAADVVLFETVDINVTERLGKPEGIERSESKALGLRVFMGQKQAIASTTDISKAALTELAERVSSMAKAAPADPDSTLAPGELLCREIPNLDLYDAAEPDSAWLTAQCKEAESTAMSVKGITNSEGADAHYSKSITSLAIADNNGVRFAGSYPSSYFTISVSVVAGEDTGMERDYDYTSARHRSDLAKPAIIGQSAAERALKRLNPRKIASCQVPVVFDPRISRSLLSTFAGAISGASVARGSTFLKDKMGSEIFEKHITIIDDPHRKRGFGSKPFDGEGVKNQKRAIVENGELKTWLLDMRTANKLGLTTTGHAARGVGSPPSPSATNLYMQPGALSPELLIKDIKKGLYVTETFGMGVNIVTGDYSQGAAGFWIENGEITYPVSEITIAGHLSDIFKTATPANDLVFRYATNAPTLRIESMTVAGT